MILVISGTNREGSCSAQVAAQADQSSQTSQAQASKVSFDPLPEVSAVELSSSSDSDDDLPF